MENRASSSVLTSRNSGTIRVPFPYRFVFGAVTLNRPRSHCSCRFADQSSPQRTGSTRSGCRQLPVASSDGSASRSGPRCSVTTSALFCHQSSTVATAQHLPLPNCQESYPETWQTSPSSCWRPTIRGFAAFIHTPTACRELRKRETSNAVAEGVSSSTFRSGGRLAATRTG